MLAILSLDVLKRIVEIFPKILLNKEIKKPELKFNPGPWSVISEFLRLTRELVNLLSVSISIKQEKESYI